MSGRKANGIVARWTACSPTSENPDMGHPCSGWRGRKVRTRLGLEDE